MTRPTKEAVRDWFRREVQAHRPPPSPEEIRRELGWSADDEEDARIIAEFQAMADTENL